MWIHSNGGRSLLLALSLLLASVYGGYSETLYSISESELTELETTLTRQREIIESLQVQLSEQSSTLTRLSTTTSEQQTLLQRQWTTIDALRESLTEYESEASRATRVSRWTGRIEGAAVGAILALTAFFVVR